MNDISQSILTTLAYHDIFDYPLKVDEVHQYLIAVKSSFSSVQEELRELKVLGIIGERRGYFFLKNRENLVAARRQRAKYSQAKLKRAKLFSRLLTRVPTVQLVAISGALAMENSHKKDDIDLVIICRKNSLWTTRFLANLVLLPFKRHPSSNLTRDRACLNIFIDESNLKVSPQSLYIAHEICQMKVLLGRNQTYSRFIKSNKWIYQFLPNWQSAISVIPAKLVLDPDRRAGIQQKKVSVVSSQLSIVERTLRSFQLWYMRNKVTTEKIGDTQLFFHPSDTQEWVLGEYQKRLKRLRITS